MITTPQNRSFIESEQYSSFILENMKDGLMPENYFRNVSDFGSGEVLNIKTIGEAQIQEVEEDAALVYSPIETGEVELRITEYVGDAWYVTDKMRQDGAQIDTLLATRGKEATRAIQEYFETGAFATLNAGQTPADLNAINGFNHRVVASGTNQTIELTDFINMKLAFDKAEVPYGGRICMVDPVTAATLTTKFQGTYNIDSNNTMQGILEGGFDRDHQFVMNIFGWNIVTSNRLPRITAETIDSVALTDGVANIFLNIADDQTKALMMAWRQQPKVEGDRNKDKQRDEFVTTARWGFGIQRVDTMGIVLTSASDIS